MSNEYPMMLYHIAFGEIIVNNKSEHNMHTLEGWSESPKVRDEVTMVREKILFYESAISNLKNRLETLEQADEPLKEESNGRPIRKRGK